ncbi:MAG: hypothetical protein ABIO70_14655 [Pseudomonadota bacterium]
MRFLFKIHSGFDGFRPAVIRQRMTADGLVRLGWSRYFDDAEIGSEVWVYFHGPHKFEPGVYIRGRVRRRDAATLTVYLKPIEISTTRPLTDAAMSARVAAAVSKRYRQVFYFPPALAPAPDCDLDTKRTTCADHRCEDCDRWKSFPRIGAGSFRNPVRLTNAPVVGFQAGWWVVPSRCYLRNAEIPPSVHQASNLFYEFKVGAIELAFPLAAALVNELRSARALRFNAVVPIPLSPDKEAAREMHRTRELARCVSELTGAPVIEALSLTVPLSKRRFIAAGGTRAAFERKYTESLAVSDLPAAGSILLLDDVATHGSTIACAARKIKQASPRLTIQAATAGQMIMKATCVSLP